MTEIVERFRDRGRARAREERGAVEWAIAELDRLCREREIDLAPVLEYARRSRESLPDRHRAAYEGMAETLAVDPDVYDAYVFAYSDLCTALGGPAVDGCTNVLAAPARAAGDGPLVFKNRDIAGRGVRPKAIVEQPPIGDFHGFLTVDTCGTTGVFKGVNDAGLVAANTYIDVARDDVDPRLQVRNGTVIRRLLEECGSVADARRLLDSLPARHLMAQTLFLADGAGGVVLEVDPARERIRADPGPIAVRTNHFADGPSSRSGSSTARRDRALELLERAVGAGGRVGERADRTDGRLARADLWAVARDHENGPGDESICRHPEPGTDEPHAFGQLTTASSALFEGGRPVVDVVTGNPCETEPTTCRLGGEIPADLRTGRRWLDRVVVERPGEVAVPLPV